MTSTIKRLVLVAAVAASALSATACSTGFLASRDRRSDETLATGDAYREAARRCNGGELRQASGTDGTNPSDYICVGH